MRSQIGATKHAGEMMLCQLKAFEYVNRAKLAEKGSRGDFLAQVVAASLAIYGFRRRLAYKG